MIGTVQIWVALILVGVCFAATVWALVDCATRPKGAFPAAGKRTKRFWLLITAIACLLCFLCLPFPIGFGLLPWMLALFAGGAALLYLVDVRPAVRPYRPRGPRRPSGGW